jgi:hypothetical protein
MTGGVLSGGRKSAGMGGYGVAFARPQSFAAYSKPISSVIRYVDDFCSLWLEVKRQLLEIA